MAKLTKLRYIGADETTTTFGVTFTRSQWVKNHGLDDDAATTLANNPQFEAQWDGDAPEPEAAPEPGAESFEPTWPEEA